MKILTNTLPNILFKLALIGAMAFVGVCSVLSTPIVVKHGFGSWRYCFYGYHPVVFGVTLLTAVVFMLRNLCTFIEITETGFRLCRFRKTIVRLDFADIAEIGVGEAYGIRGKKKKLYFSPFPLSEREKKNLDLVQDRIIYFSSFGRRFAEYLMQDTALRKAILNAICR